MKNTKIDYSKFIKPGQTADDIMPLFADRKAFASAVNDLAEPFQGVGVDKVAGIEAGRQPRDH